MGSYSQRFPYRCQNGHEGALAAWLVVDGEERPDLLRRAGEGELTPPRCPECGAEAGIRGQLSLLVFRPGQRPEILFGSATPDDGDRVRQQAQLSMMMLNRGRGSPAGGGAIVVPYDLLAVMAPRDVEADADALDAGGFAARSPRLQRYRDWLEGYARERFEQATKPVLLAVLQAGGPEALREVIGTNPVLLDSRVDALLGHLAEVAEQEGQPQMAYAARSRRELLHQVREHGLDQVLPAGPPPQAREEGDAGRDGARSEQPSLTPAVGTALVAMAGHPVGGHAGPLGDQELRPLLERALAEISPGEAELALEYEHGELVGLRDVLTLYLATALLAAPRDRNDQLEALRLLGRLGHLRQTAPRAWAKAEHNAATGAAALAAPGDVAALDAARAGYERALEVRTREASPDDWADTTIALADLLRQAYPSHESRYLDRSVALLEDALADPPPGLSPAARLRLATSRATGVLVQADYRNDAEALRRAIEGFETVLAEARRSGDAEVTRVALSNLGRALAMRAERSGRPADWAGVADTLREALCEAAGGTPSQWLSAAVNLSIALRHAGDVEAAIPLMREILERAEAGRFWTAWASTQNNLGNALLQRTAGDRDENVDQAIGAYDGARRVWTREAFPVEWALTTARLALAYEAAPGGRDRAAALLREAAGHVSRDERPVDWARLSNRLASYEPPARAVERYQAAAEVLTRDGFPHEWASIQHNLGGLYQDMAGRADSEEARAYLTAAVGCYRSALAARPAAEDPLQWAETATALGGALSRGGNRAEAVSVLGRALEVLRAGAPAARVITAASRLGVLLAEDGRWPDAAGALREAVDAADRLYATSLLRRSREQTISENSWLSSALAYCHVRQGDHAEAVGALEHGRTRLLGEALARDPERVALARATHPGEYEAYVAAVRRLAAAEAASTRLAAEPPAEAAGAYHRRAEQAARDELREARAAFEGASSRLPEPPAAPPETAAGSVTVYLFSTGLDSTALLVWPDAVESVPMPGVDDRLLRRFVHGDDQRPGLLRAQRESRRRLRAELGDCLGVLGPQAMRPVADALRTRGARAVTLIPVGLFAAIPLHAAPIGADGRCLLDDLPVSYAPSGAVLAEARRSARRRGGKPSGLAVIDPTAGLAFTGYEVDAMLGWIGGRRVDSSTADVAAELPGATHIHFACHGRSLVDRPLDSCLVLGRGRQLTVLDLLASERPDLLRAARMVVASACQTATAEVMRTPDEFIGLAAGFLAAGVPCFVGTLWPSDDIPSALVMSRFYELLAGAGQGADEALRQAQRWLRDLDGRALLEHLESRPGLATIRPGLVSLAAAQPDRRFYADPVSWSPYVVIGSCCDRQR